MYHSARHLRDGILVVFMALLFSGCATVIDLGRLPPSDFPKLTVTEHYVSQKEMHDRCLEASSRAIACTFVYFDSMTADIWYSTDPLPSKELIEHEWKHTEGYDHIGESTFRDAWEAFKQRKKSRAR